LFCEKLKTTTWNFSSKSCCPTYFVQKKYNKLTSLWSCLAPQTLALVRVLAPCQIDVAGCTKENLPIKLFNKHY
jgi:hypothetical protein